MSGQCDTGTQPEHPSQMDEATIEAGQKQASSVAAARQHAATAAPAGVELKEPDSSECM
jgi:hypothetical protein